MRNLEGKRIAKTNDERAAAAARRGWEIRVDAPDLPDRWRYALPFSLRGEQEQSFGVVSGLHRGAQFVAFDFYRQAPVKVVRDTWSDTAERDEPGMERINTVWVVKLPVRVPWFQIMTNLDPVYDVTGLPEPLTADPKFSRWYRMVNTDPQVTAQVLHPQVRTLMRRDKLHTWALVEDELVFTTYPIFGRTSPDELVATLDKLIELVALLPFPVLKQHR